MLAPNLGIVAVQDVFVYDAIRSARTRAKSSGGLHELTPQSLLSSLYGTLVERTGLNPACVGDVILGCVTQHGEQAANIAKTSVLHAGWPSSVGGLTVNRFCSSSIDAMSIGMLKIAAGQEDAIASASVRVTSLSVAIRSAPEPIISN